MYGWLKKGRYGWLNRGLGGGGGAGTVYNYGYPAYGSLEPDVSAQFLFDEASGNIVDEVSGLTLTAAGTSTYSVTASGSYSGISPGITTGNSKYFSKAADATLDFGTSNFTIEFWGSTSDATGPNYIMSFYDATNKGIELTYNTMTQILVFYIEATDGTSVFNSTTWSSINANDGTPHKFRFVATRTGSIVLYVDGVSKGSINISTLSGKTVKAGAIKMAERQSLGQGWKGTCYEYRQSLNNTNNSGGPNGG